MSGTVRRLPASRRQQPQCREQRRKKVADNIWRKMSLAEPQQQIEIRSPLADKINLPNSAGICKPVVQKQVNKENIEQNTLKKTSLVVNLSVIPNHVAAKPLVKAEKPKESNAITFSQSFLKTKSIKERQLKDEKIIEVNKDVLTKPAKPVLGAYRGKIVPSKINSFWKPSDGTEARRKPSDSTEARRKPPTEEKKCQVTAPKAITRSQSSNIVTKQTTTSVPVGAVKPRVPTAKPGKPTISASTNAIKTRPELGTTLRPTHTFIQRNSVDLHVMKKCVPDKNMKVVGVVIPQTSLPNKRRTMAVPVNPKPSHDKKPSAQPAVGSKYQRPKETAEERKARLAAWKAANGKVMKRPPQTVAVPSTYKVPKEEPEEHSEPEPVKEPSPKLFWATMAEEDEQELFTVKVHKMFAECQKLIDEDFPKDDVLSILETNVKSIPEAKKLAKYWECLASLEQRQGRLDQVIAVCEEAVAAGAQPLDKLRNILADALENLKTTTSDSGNSLQHEDVLIEAGAGVKCEPEVKPEAEVKSKPVEQDKVKIEKRPKTRKAMKTESKEKRLTWNVEEKPQCEPRTPERGGETSVIKFTVRSTPYLQSIKKNIQNTGEPQIKDLKFLTPVRRSMRIEHKSQQLPDMLKDHDPCLSTLSQLGDLGSDSQAYIYRHNDAITEVNANNLPKQ